MIAWLYTTKWKKWLWVEKLKWGCTKKTHSKSLKNFLLKTHSNFCIFGFYENKTKSSRLSWAYLENPSFFCNPNLKSHNLNNCWIILISFMLKFNIMIFFLNIFYYYLGMFIQNLIRIIEIHLLFYALHDWATHFSLSSSIPLVSKIKFVNKLYKTLFPCTHHSNNYSVVTLFFWRIKYT